MRPKPVEYSQYLRQVLDILKLPIRNGQPIPWDDIKSIRSLSSLAAPPKISKVVLRLPAPSTQGKHDAKGKGVERSTVNVKNEVEDVEMNMVCPTLGFSDNSPLTNHPPDI